MSSHSPTRPAALPAQKLDELVRRLVDALHPLRIYLFGSHARGTAREDSDVDVMIVHDPEQEPYDVIRRAYAAIRDLPTPIELHVRDARTFGRRCRDAGTIEHEVVATGHLVYQGRIPGERRVGHRGPTLQVCNGSARRWIMTLPPETHP